MTDWITGQQQLSLAEPGAQSQAICDFCIVNPSQPQKLAYSCPWSNPLWIIGMCRAGGPWLRDIPARAGKGNPPRLDDMLVVEDARAWRWRRPTVAGVAHASPATHSKCCGLPATEDGVGGDRRMAVARAVGTDAEWRISRSSDVPFEPLFFRCPIRSK